MNWNKTKEIHGGCTTRNKLDLSQMEITWTLKRQNKAQVNVVINCPRVHEVTKKGIAVLFQSEA